MLNILDDLRRENDMLEARLKVRDFQCKIAVEGLNHIVRSNDPVGIASQTLEAMDKCMPKSEDLE